MVVYGDFELSITENSLSLSRQLCRYQDKSHYLNYYTALVLTIAQSVKIEWVSSNLNEHLVFLSLHVSYEINC